MTTIADLKKLIAIEKIKEAKRKKAQLKIDEKNQLKKQLFNLKHGSKIKTFRKIGAGFKTAGGNLKHNLSGLSKDFKKQRKKKKGLGGFLQKIADRQ